MVLYQFMLLSVDNNKEKEKAKVEPHRVVAKFNEMSDH